MFPLFGKAGFKNYKRKEIQSTEERVLHIRSRSIRWYLRKARSPNADTILIFHGNDFHRSPASFKDIDWNVICPIDNFGYRNFGSWYLGENRNFFWPDAIEAILEIVNRENQIGNLYCYGSSMGGYASILYGYLHKAHGIYSSVPQTKLLGSTYGKEHKKFFSPVFNNQETPYNDLVNFITRKQDTMYVIAASGMEKGNYIQEQCLPLINKLYSLGQPYYLQINPCYTHKKHHTVKEGIELIKYAISLLDEK